MDVKNIESLRWEEKPKNFNMSTRKILRLIDNLIKDYAERFNVSFDDFKKVFEEKNKIFYTLLSEYFNDENNKSEESMDKVRLIYCSLFLPDTKDYVELLYNDFIRLTDSEKIEFLKRIEPIKSKLEI